MSVKIVLSNKGGFYISMTNMPHVGAYSSVAREAMGNIAITMNRQHNLNIPIRPVSNQVLLTLCYSRVDVSLFLMKLSSFIPPSIYTDVKYIRFVSGRSRRPTGQFPKRIPFHTTRRNPWQITLLPHIPKVAALIDRLLTVFLCRYARSENPCATFMFRTQDGVTKKTDVHPILWRLWNSGRAKGAKDGKKKKGGDVLSETAARVFLFTRIFLIELL